jgi:hypothetical protein
MLRKPELLRRKVKLPVLMALPQLALINYQPRMVFAEINLSQLSALINLLQLPRLASLPSERTPRLERKPQMSKRLKPPLLMMVKLLSLRLSRPKVVK